MLGLWQEVFSKEPCTCSLPCIYFLPQIYLSCMVPASEETIQDLAEADLQYAQAQRQQGWRATKAFLPPLRIACPLLPPAHSLDAQQMREKWLQRISTPGTSYQAFEGSLVETPHTQQCDDGVIPFLGHGWGPCSRISWSLSDIWISC